MPVRYPYQTLSAATPSHPYPAFYPAHTSYSGYVYVATAGMSPGQVPAPTGSSSGPPVSASSARHHAQHQSRVGQQQSSQNYTTTTSRPQSTSSSNMFHIPASRMALRRGNFTSSMGANDGMSNTSATTRGTWSRQSSEGSLTDNIRPQFRSKVVCELTCRHCTAVVCRRGMKAILLADMNIELFSTDVPPNGVQLVNDDYQTRNCFCRIRDVACLGCGNVIGYHVTQPCEPCMEACNNGHFWMFHISEVAYADRLDSAGTRALLWAHLPRADKDMEFADIYDKMCR
ncbi:hypothetical protein SpCBS45565_g07854 [Spizellomyces sp. 'palustris']|nr:hypothetical protein SpCBS45565_g07854 [Spizellomyces sp. 'palustris']